jgi:colanic acid/amylovoran biosynthesis glycosyltransferase
LHQETFIAVGRFVDKKAPYYTLLAFKEVLKEFPNATLVMAGDGILHNSIKNLIRYYQLEKNVKLIGIIRTNEFLQILQDARAFVQHSITASNGDMEGTPLGVLEACAAGVPVISTYHAGIPDVIIHGFNGLLCEEHDVLKMSENMKLVLIDKNRAGELGANARQTILNNFQLDRHLHILSEVIIKAIG